MKQQRTYVVIENTFTGLFFDTFHRKWIDIQDQYDALCCALGTVGIEKHSVIAEKYKIVMDYIVDYDPYFIKLTTFNMTVKTRY